MLEFRIKGVPYCRNKSRGNKGAAKKWTSDVCEQTIGLPIVDYSCHVKVIFHLPENKFPKDFPYGPDIDNLLKRTFDGLNSTIFNNAIGKDSCAIRVEARKVMVNRIEDAGARFEIKRLKF